MISSPGSFLASRYDEIGFINPNTSTVSNIGTRSALFKSWVGAARTLKFSESNELLKSLENFARLDLGETLGFDPKTPPEILRILSDSPVGRIVERERSRV